MVNKGTSWKTKGHQVGKYGKQRDTRWGNMVNKGTPSGKYGKQRDTKYGTGVNKMFMCSMEMYGYQRDPR